MNDLVIIDGNSLINRAFYALPLLSNKEGVYSNAVFGFCNMLIKVIVEDKPSFICVAFDYGKHTFRNDMYSDYKAGRKSMPDELRSQLPLLKEILSYMNIKIIEKEGIEADDIIGTLSKRFPEKTIILTGDRDSLQLIDDSTEVWLTKKGLSNVDIMNRETLFDTYKITPSQVIDIKSLMGDASDNIPGVEGVGEVTAVKLLDKYKTLDGVYENIDKINGSLKDKLIKDKDKAYLSYKLATIVTNCDIDCKIDNCVYDFPFNDKVYEFFKKYDFNSLIKRKELFLNNNIKDNTEINNLNKNVEIKEIKNSEILENIIKEIKIKNQFGFYFDNLAYLSIDGKVNIKYL
jgi:DNA polymerase-1